MRAWRTPDNFHQRFQASWAFFIAVLHLCLAVETFAAELTAQSRSGQANNPCIENAEFTSLKKDLESLTRLQQMMSDILEKMYQTNKTAIHRIKD
jgi:hypothetical protein